MVSLKDLWGHYSSYTRDLTEHSRKLGFAAAAICWFFKSDQVTFPKLIVLSLGCVVLFFILDILHQLVAAITIKNYVENKEKELMGAERKPLDLETKVPRPRRLDKWPHRFFRLKLAFLITSFAFLMAEFTVRMFH